MCEWKVRVRYSMLCVRIAVEQLVPGHVDSRESVQNSIKELLIYMRNSSTKLLPASSTEHKHPASRHFQPHPPPQQPC